MDLQSLKSIIATAKLIQDSVSTAAPLPSEVVAPADQPVIPHSLFTGAPGYILKVVHQINASYSATAYDGCAVMIRRLVELLIIEAFEKKQVADKIKDTDGNYYMLAELVKRTLAESATFGSFGQNVRKGLAELKTVGDQSAHSRYYNAQRWYIDDQKINLRTVAERFLYIAGYRK